MRNLNYELILNDITTGESLAPFNKDFEDYKKMVFLFLNHKGKYLFAEDILKHSRDGVTLERVFETESGRFLPASNKSKDGKIQRTWFDLWSMEEVERSDDFFDFFFASKLRQLSLLEVGDFLSFHLDHSFKNNKPEFLKFLNLPLSQHQKLITPNIREAINEWAKTSEAINTDNTDPSDKEEKIKGRISREPGDHLTSLNLNQIALLIQLMQQTGVILKGDYLTYTQAGKAFNLLTGYSAHTIRQQLGTKGEIEGVKFEDYKELHETLLRMASLIEDKTHKNKRTG